MTRAEFYSAEEEHDRLMARMDELAVQHDPNSGTYFDDEPWQAEYEELSLRVDELQRIMDANEESVLAREDRKFLPPEVDGNVRAPGDHAWDHWQAWAVEDGISEELAGLGRAVIREASQNNWTDELKAECGWSDSGESMLHLAKTDPERARIRWGYLLESDGDFWWK